MGPSPVRELEKLEYASGIEQRRQQLRAKIEEIKADAARRGFQNSGISNTRICEAWEAFERDLIQLKLELRKRFGSRDSTLLSDNSLRQLEAEMVQTITTCNQARKGEVTRAAHATGAVVSLREDVIDVNGLTALARLGVKKLTLERDIGMMNESPQQHGAITINVQNSAIAAFNLNSVVRDVTATVNSLYERGDEPIAQALKALTEVVGNEEAFGVQRREILEALSGLGEQAKLPPDARRLGIVKPLFAMVRDSLAMTSSAATIWQEWGQQIQQFFGF